VGPLIDIVRIESLKRQVESSRLDCDDLASHFEGAQSSTKTKTAHQYVEALKHARALRRLWELLEREERRNSGEVDLERTSFKQRADSSAERFAEAFPYFTLEITFIAKGEQHVHGQHQRLVRSKRRKNQAHCRARVRRLFCDI